MLPAFILLSWILEALLCAISIEGIPWLLAPSLIALSLTSLGAAKTKPSR
jgi:hypothetical protein